MTARPKRIGMITPSSNTVVEPVTIAMTATLYPRVTCHFTRIAVKTISLADDSLTQFDLSTMLGAARLLADAGMDRAGDERSVRQGSEGFGGWGGGVGGELLSPNAFSAS